jgi:hypothetical protein
MPSNAAAQIGPKPNHQFNQNLPELVLIEAIQQLAMKRDESLSPSLFTFRSRLTAVHHHLVLRFYDGGLSTSEDKQIFVAAERILDLTRHLTSGEVS